MKQLRIAPKDKFLTWAQAENSIKNSHYETCYLDDELLRDAIDFYNEYFGYKLHPISREEVFAYAALGTRINADFWKSLVPGEDPEIVDFFYRVSPFHFFNNILRFMDGMHREICLEIESRFKSPMLDFGGGTGGIAIYFASKGWDVTFIESSNICQAWVQWISDKRKLNIKVLEKPEGKYKFINAKDVIEHVLDPEGLMKYLRSFLDTDGKIHASHFPCDGPDEMAPMHFKVSLNNEAELHNNQ